MLKIGTQTGSLINHLHSRAVIGQPDVVVGMGATILHWSDRSPATIFRVFKIGKLTYIETRDDRYTRIDANGMSESQEYEYKTDINGARRYFRKTESGMWEGVRKNEETGRWIKTKSSGVRVGERERYYDFSF